MYYFLSDSCRRPFSPPLSFFWSHARSCRFHYSCADFHLPPLCWAAYFLTPIHPHCPCQSISNSLNQSGQAVSVSRCVNTLLPTAARTGVKNEPRRWGARKHLPRPHIWVTCFVRVTSVVAVAVTAEKSTILLLLAVASLSTYDFCANTHRQFLSPGRGGRWAVGDGWCAVGVPHLSYSNLKFNLLAS